MALVESHTHSAGRAAVDFDLMGVDEERYSLKDFVFHKWLCIIFTCNHCPYAKASRAPLIELSYTYPGIAFLAINSNDAEAYPEDDFQAMKTFSKKYGLSFPYVYDADQSVAKSYDAQCTPDIYLFENKRGNFELFYQWRINDNWQGAYAVTEKNLEDHCAKLIAGERPSDVRPPSIGCSIKWKGD